MNEDTAKKPAPQKRTIPTKGKPFHTKKYSKVYHDSPDCAEGANIEPDNRVTGTAGYRHCARCLELKCLGEWDAIL